MGTLPASRSQHQCWEIGAGAGNQMGTAGSQNSGGSQHGCWEPERLGVKILVVPSTGAGKLMLVLGTNWEPKRESKIRWFPARLLGTKWELLSRFPAPQKRPMNTPKLGVSMKKDLVAEPPFTRGDFSSDPFLYNFNREFFQNPRSPGTREG